MALNHLRAYALAKPETTYGTDAIPTVSANALLLREAPTWGPEPSFAERRLYGRGYHGAYPRLPNGKDFVNIALQWEAAGFGTAGPTSPTAGYDALMRATGHQRVITTGTSVAYSPISTGHEGASLYYNIDGVLRKARGFRGQLKFNLEDGEIPYFTAEGKALYTAMTDTAFAAPTVSAYVAPVPANLTNTTAFSLFGFSTACLRSFEFDSGYQTTYRAPINCTEQIWYTGQREATGKVSVEATTVAQKDFFATLRAGTAGAVTLTHGPGTNRVKFDGPAAQITNISSQEEDGVWWLDIDLLFRPNTAGNDEYVFTIL